MGTYGTTRDRSAGKIADRQFGVAHYDQLIGADLTPRMIRRAVQAGRLRPLFRAVFAVGHRALSREGWWMAALLACGEDSVLSYHSAAALWDLKNSPTLPIHVTVASQKGRKLDGIRIHRVAELPKLIRVDGLRVTTPARVIVDLAATHRGRDMRHLIERAQDKGRFHPREIAAEAQNRRGTKQLRDLLAAMNDRSYLERLFLAVIRQARLPRPETQFVIAGKARDFVWPDARLVVETDGYRYHSSPEAMTRDRRRDRELTALGWRPVRFTFEELAFEPQLVASAIKSLI